MIYLNNAATTFPKPDETIEAVTSYLGSTPFQCLRSGYAGREDDAISSCRKKLADFFNAPCFENIIFTSGATEALNLAILGLDLAGSHVITTCIEHNSVLRPLKMLEKEGRIELYIARCDHTGRVDSGDIAENVRDNTKAIIVNHCSNVTGRLTDLEEVSGICSSRGILFIVDASQSAGCVPVDVQKSGIDILVFTGHKSLYGIPGIGGAYIKPGIGVAPLKVGGTGIKSELEYQPEELPLRYEAGTPNVPGIVALGAGVDFIVKTRIDNIYDRKMGHFTRMVEELKDNPKIEIYGETDTENRMPILCFNISGILPEDAARILEDSYDIITRSGLHCAPLIHKALGTFPEGAVRVSPSYFTTDEEVDRVIDAVSQVCEVNAA